MAVRLPSILRLNLRARSAALLLALAACQTPPTWPPPSDAIPVSTQREETSFARSFWTPPPAVDADLDEVAASAMAARSVLEGLPELERRRVLARFLPFGPPPASAEGLGEPAAAPREQVPLLAVMRELFETYRRKELALAAFFVGPAQLERARWLSRISPERLEPGALAGRLKRRDQPGLRYAREAVRGATFYGLAWPVERTWRLTSLFGPRFHPILGVDSNHRGLDISMPVGTEIRAPADGVVTRVRQDSTNGQWLELDHGLGVRTLYCHLSTVNVKRGDKVKSGAVVALSGDTGRVTGPHLHYQVKRSGAFVDPLSCRTPESVVAAPIPLLPEPKTAPIQASAR